MNSSTLTTYQFWTTEEENLLRKLAGKMSFQIMANIYFPNKTALALQRKSTKMKLTSGFRKKTYTHNETFWEKPSLLNSYWAGFSAADANLHSKKRKFSIQLHSKDHSHLNKFKNATEFTGRILSYKNYPIISICSCTKWYKDLADIWSITPAKTYSLQPPNIIEKNLILSYIIGFIDGDGWISYREKNKRIRIGFVNSSLSLLEWIKNHIEEYFPFYEKTGQIAPQPLTVKQSSRGNYYELHIDGLRGIRILDSFKHFIEQNNLPHLNRKWNDPRLIQQIKADKLRYPFLFNV